MKFIVFCFLLMFSSCYSQSHKPTKDELNQTLKSSKYANIVLNKFSNYQALAHVLNKNLDKIIAFTDSKEHKINKSAIGEYCFSYYYNSVAQNTNIKDMPNFVYKQVDSLWKLIGENNIINIDVCNDKTVIINTMIDKAPNNTQIVHQLIWNIQPFDNNHSFDLYKDSLLNKECTYRLGISENY